MQYTEHTLREKSSETIKAPVHSSKQSTSPSAISVHVCACMYATVIPKIPAAMREVLAVGGRMGTDKREAEATADGTLLFFFHHSSLGNHSYRREHVTLVL